MSSAASSYPGASINPADLDSFARCLATSHRILALVGAGLSAPSGIQTFRGEGGLWRGNNAKELASPYAFKENPLLVWQFYNERKHKALNAMPNQAHYALAELARKRSDFITISQNVDGLSERANHPQSQLHLIHGSLLHVRCTACDYAETDNTVDTFAHESATSKEAAKASTLPYCPKCRVALLRPGVVWFGERLPDDAMNAIDGWMEAAPISLMLVIGTSSSVFPAAEYIELAKEQGARVAVVNTNRDDEPPGGLEEGDWFFEGDAAVLVPEMLQSVIGVPIGSSGRQG